MNPPFFGIRRVLAELRPMPDRLAGTLRITAAVLLAVLVMLTFRNSMLAVGPFLVFLLMQRSTLMTTMSVVLVIPSMLLTSALLIAIEMVAWDTAWLRILLMGLLFWTGFWTMSRYPAASVIAVLPMSFLSVMIFYFDQYPDPNRILSQIGWIWAALGIALGSTLLVQRISRAPSGMEVFRDDVRRLLGAAEEACLLRSFGHVPLPAGRIGLTMARDDRQILLSLERLAKVGLLTKLQTENCRAIIGAAGDVLAKAKGETVARTSSVWKELSLRLRRLRTTIRDGRPLSHDQLAQADVFSLPCLEEAERAVGLPSSRTRSVSGRIPTPLLPEFTDAEFAQRATLATMSCYFFASLTDWSGIHTCMITCVVTALSRLEAQNSKQFQRLLGATLGGIMSLVAMVWLIPATNGLTGVLLTLAAGTAIAAWCSSGREKVSYVGLQMGLAFYLTILQDPHATTNLDTLRDRLVGIYVGILAMRFFFTMPLPWSPFYQLSRVPRSV